MKGVRLHLDLDTKVPAVGVNENEIAQVILNLANNAADSMPAGGKLDISTHYDGATDRICIVVHDTGSGIKESDSTREFEPFFTTIEVDKGTGLGLSICYKIVAKHLGSIAYATVLGNGTTFRGDLPARTKAEASIG